MKCADDLAEIVQVDLNLPAVQFIGHAVIQGSNFIALLLKLMHELRTQFSAATGDGNFFSSLLPLLLGYAVTDERVCHPLYGPVYMD